MDVVIFLSYFAVALLCWPLFGYAAVRYFTFDSTTDAGDYVLGSLIGLIMALFWPFSLIVWGGAKMIMRIAAADRDRQPWQ